MTDSSTGGYLVPAASPAPLQGQSLEDFLHDVIAGITGLDEKLVRPSYQPEPPNPPNFGTAWCSFRIQSRETDDYGYVEHDAGDEDASDPVAPSDKLQRHQTLNLLVSFYDMGQGGGSADDLAQQLSDGLLIDQNREALTLAGMAVKNTGQPVSLPSLAKERWYYRVDLPIAIRRQIRRSYPIYNVATGHFELIAQDPSGEIVLDEIINIEP